MDCSLLTTAATAIAAAKQLGQAALGVRDFNQIADTVAKLNLALLQAQDSLFAHNAQFSELQGKYFEACEELRKLKEAARERGSYALVEVGVSQFAYQVNLTPQASGAGDPSGAQPLHYICQPCFDFGRKVVLQLEERSYGIYLGCPVCKTEISVPQTI